MQVPGRAEAQAESNSYSIGLQRTLELKLWTFEDHGTGAAGADRKSWDVLQHSR